MGRLVASVTTLALLLAAPLVAGAQDKGNVLDILRDVLQGNKRLQGHVVLTRPGEVIVRGDDGRTYHVSTAGLDASKVPPLQPGQPVTVDSRGASQEGVLTASSIEPGSGQRETFDTVEGTVVSVEGPRVTFRTDSGFVMPVDLSQVVGRQPTLAPNDRATLYYEQAPSAITAVWLEPGTSASSAGRFPSTGPSASPPTAGGTSSPTSPSASPGPSSGSAGGTAAYQRLHGYIESVGLSSISLKTDDGRSVQVDFAKAVDEAVWRQLRPGDLVSVVGKPTGDNRFLADVVRPER
jgi:hypothetical protein